MGSTLDNGYVDLSYGTAGGNLDCTDSAFLNYGNYAIQATGMNINGTVFLRTLNENKDENKGFKANSLICLTGSKLGMDLICTNGNFNFTRTSKIEPGLLCAIKANSMTIAGKVKMNGREFKAIGGVKLDNTNIGSYLDCKNGAFTAPTEGKSKNLAISASKLITGGNIYLSEGFTAKGEVMLNDASIGRNLICKDGKIENKDSYTLHAMQMNIGGSIEMEKFESQGEVCMDYSIIGGNLICKNAKFINNNYKNQKNEGDPAGGIRQPYAFHGNGVKIVGWAEFSDDFQVDGIVSLQNSDIGMRLTWKKIQKNSNASLFLDQAKAGSLEDDNQSWPDNGKLQINDFEYRFLVGLNSNNLKERIKDWLSRPSDFRSQPYEHLSALLMRSGYEAEAKEVLIAKNRKLKNKYDFKNFALDTLVSYGYKPFKALWIGLVLIFVGGILFSIGFQNNLMVPTKDGGRFIYQIAESTALQDKTDIKPMKIENDHGLYPFIYALDTFLPGIDLQTADYWLPTAHPPESTKFTSKFFNWFLCFYRWFLIVSGWVLTTFFLAALGGIVRR